MIDELRHSAWEADAAINALQRALDLPFRPIALQPIADLYKGIEALATENMVLRERNDYLFAQLWGYTV